MKFETKLYLYSERAGWSALYTFLGSLGADALFDLNFGTIAAATAAGLGAALNVIRDFSSERLKKLRQREEQMSKKEKA